MPTPCKHFEYFDYRKAKLASPRCIFSFDPQGIRPRFFCLLGVEAKPIFGLIRAVSFRFAGRLASTVLFVAEAEGYVRYSFLANLGFLGAAWSISFGRWFLSFGIRQ